MAISAGTEGCAWRCPSSLDRFNLGNDAPRVRTRSLSPAGNGHPATGPARIPTRGRPREQELDSPLRKPTLALTGENAPSIVPAPDMSVAYAPVLVALIVGGVL